jgi:hypothetical protein|eukprot:5334288-Prymnesium_polylepis.2
MYRARHSQNGVSDWSDGQYVTVEGDSRIGTFTMVNTPSLDVMVHGQPSRLRFLGGYEGEGGEACLAESDDGLSWSNLHSRGDHGDNDDDGWTERRCYGESSSFLGRAADAYVMPVVVSQALTQPR